MKMNQIMGDDKVGQFKQSRSSEIDKFVRGSILRGRSSIDLQRNGFTIERHRLPGEFERQGARDWETFLSLRAELRSGARLVVVLPGVTDDGITGFERIMDQANAVLADMVADGALTAEDRARMTIGNYPRRKSELLAPFERDGRFQQLSVEEFETAELPDAAWTDYERDGNREVLATRHARFFRSTFMPSLASALDPVRSGDAEALRLFADRLEAGLRERVASQPSAMHSFVQIIVFAKRP